MTTASSYDELFAAVRDRTGVQLALVNTGGGCYVARGRLETGQWLVVAEAEDFLFVDPRQRFAYEAERETQCGWYIGMFDNDTSEGADFPDSENGPLDSITDDQAHFGDLPAMIVAILRNVAAGHAGGAR